MSMKISYFRKILMLVAVEYLLIQFAGGYRLSANMEVQQKMMFIRNLKQLERGETDGICALQDDADCPFVSNARSIAAICITVVVAAVANAAGIGGGAFFVPLFNVLVGFSMKSSTGLSQVVVTGGAIASVTFNLFQSHPSCKGRALIDFELSLILTPTILFGISLGVLFNNLFPEWLLAACMTVMLFYLTYRPLRKGLIMWKLENKKDVQSRKSVESLKEEQNNTQEVGNQGIQVLEREIQDLEYELQQHPQMELYTCCSAAYQDDSCQEDMELDSKVSDGARNYEDASQLETEMKILTAQNKNGSHINISNEDSLDLQTTDTYNREAESNGLHVTHIDIAEASDTQRVPKLARTSSSQASCLSRTPFFKMVQLILLWVAFLVLSVFKTVQGSCGKLFWGMWTVQAVLVTVVTCLFIWQTLKLHNSLRHDTIVAIDNKVDYRKQGLVKLSAFSFIAGVIGGLMGLGGGMIIGPFLLELGVLPQVSAATSAVVVLFSSSSAVFQFIIDGNLNQAYAIVFGLTSLAASFCGIFVVSRLVKKLGRPSIIVLILACVIGLGAVLTGAFGVTDAVKDLEDGEYMGFNSLCD
eukprot:TRINITY_DN10705_c0_g3_i5.p1 TRINITY_DN10705_c0_g3~~TRINITY_DN10705_c0_g3_i5.p1  ORF type:complete len:587 (+),score=69.70 TRINITY_DN10705_c0_g3_i5:168-1928(+)